jgi:D-alanyl-D-alanine carboxypeptidase/D-alanyl-D-alanine-endopeptidase (penicillin-binding protein 4)
VLTAGVRAADYNVPVKQKLSAADLRATRVALYALDLSDGRELFAIDESEPIIPASNMKLITTAAALDLLGPDFVFRTELHLLPAADAAQLPSLLIVGDGDPALGDPAILQDHNLQIDQLLAAWVAKVQEARVTHVKHLIVDDRVFDQEFVHPSWPTKQLNRWYCAQVAGINFYDNTIDVLPRPTVSGQAPQITLIPDVPFLVMNNRATSGGADTFWIERKLGGNEMTFWGKVKNRRTEAVPVTIDDPPVFFAQILSHRLALAGIKVEGLRRASASEQFPPSSLLLRVETTLQTVLDRCNTDSQNLFAEALIKRMGRAFTGQPGSWENGAAAIRNALARRLGPGAIAIHIADGSGMSRDNRVTAKALVELLASLHHDPQRGPLLQQSLAVAGESGTFERRFHNGLRGRVLGKSGYLDGVCAISGYLLVPTAPAPGSAAAGSTADKPGDNAAAPARTVAFSMIFNDFKPPIYLHKLQELQESILTYVDQRYQERLAPPTPAPGSVSAPAKP